MGVPIPVIVKQNGVPMFDTSQYLFPAQPLGAGFALIALAFIALEALYLIFRHPEHSPDFKETVASLFIAVGHKAARLVTAALIAVPFFALHQQRLFDVPMQAAWAWVVLFISVEFCYYWMHRAAHRVRWMWATHSVHHSATHFNLSAAVRLGWTGSLSGTFLFFLPLAWIGFHPAAIAVVMGLGLAYQFFLHTSLPIRLGPLEWVLNTPAHHRLHHACNERYLDCNFGSVLIVFDRLFGTFVEEQKGEAIRFGLKGREPSRNPMVVVFREWVLIGRDVVRARSLRDVGRALFGAP